MDIVEIFVGMHVVFQHHPTQGGAMGVKITLLHKAGLFQGQIQETRHKFTHALAQLST